MPGFGLADWSSYRPSDFLMFSPAVYWRLFETLNRELWPAALLMAGLLGALLAASVYRANPRALQAAVAVLALAWLLTAWAFLVRAFAPINPSAEIAAWTFALQAVFLLGLAASGLCWRQPATAPWHRTAGFGLFVWAGVGHPWLAWASGRPPGQAELFALAPDPTVLATLGLLLLCQAPTRPGRILWRLSWVVTLAWCGVGGALLLTLGSAQGWAMWGAALLALVSVWQGRPASNSRRLP